MTDYETITLCICVPAWHTAKIRVNPSEACRHLFRLARDESSLFWRGQLLDPNKSFRYYNIQTNEIIILVKQDKKSEEIWERRTADTDFEAYLRPMFNKNLKNELARLQDLSMSRYERDRRLQRCVNARFKACQYSTLQARHETTTSEAIAPVTDPLPVAW